MSSSDADDLFARIVRQMRAATAEQIETARKEQATLAQQGQALSLADVLLKQGAITPEARASVESAQLAQQASFQDQVGVQIVVYKLLKKLGEGGMGTVFLAEDTASKSKTKVAVKVLTKRHASNATFLARFHREAKAASKLKHPNIVGTFAARETDAGVEGGVHFYAMEYCEGETLEQLLKRDGFVPWQRAAEIVVEAARGLQYAHAQGFIHRDVKPGNIYLTTKGVPKIFDMGLSKNIVDAGQAAMTLEGQILGTPHYVAPEQAQGSKTLDGRADIYALGATFYHMLTGQPPFDAEAPAAIIIKHVTEPVPNPQRIRPDIPDSIYHVIQKMMGKDPTERYHDCAALLADLEPLSRGETVLSPSALAAQAAMADQKRQADEDARFLQKFIHYGKYACMGLGVLVVFFVGRSIVRSFFGPSQRDLQQRETVTALQDAGEASLKTQDWKKAYEQFDKIVALAESGESSDAVVREAAERAKLEKEKLAAKLAEEERRKLDKEREARRAEEEQKQLAEEQKQKADEEKKRADEERRQAAVKQAEDARLAEEKRKTDEEARLAAERAAEEKKRKDEAALAEKKRKEEEARVERERRKELNKKRDALRAECLKPAETALAELSRLEKMLSDGTSYAQFAETLRDNWSRVQGFLDTAEMKELVDDVKDPEAADLRAHVKAAGERFFECQGAWREKRDQHFDLQPWLNKTYGELEDAKAAYEKFKKME
ncbi:MAG: protein kinase [Planctomycetota bacterium]|nr:protein kinase [Planctomycetota bacterium]